MSSRKIALIGGGVPSLPHQAPHEPVPACALAAALTLAERQVIGLARCGLSNQEAAALRGASVSTVAKQLSTAYKKLGIAGRRELCALLSEPLPSAHALASSLTAREVQMLSYARQGLSNKFIAGSLGITISAVSTTLTRARRKLGSSGTGQVDSDRCCSQTYHCRHVRIGPSMSLPCSTETARMEASIIMKSKRNIGKTIAAALVIAGTSLSAGNSQAAFSGLTNTAITGSVAAVPNQEARPHIDAGGGPFGLDSSVAVFTDTTNVSAPHFAKISVPITRQTSSTSVSGRVQALGNSTSQVCMAVYAYDSSGVFVGSASGGCTDFVPSPGCSGLGNNPCMAYKLLSASATVPPAGHMLIDTFGMNATAITGASITYTSSGS